MAANIIKVLLLEDDAAHAEAIRRALKATRYKVRVTGTLREYRDSVVADPPDIAILDMFLPDGGAMEVLSSHQPANAFPLLIMTSQGNEQHAVDAMKAGAHDYIVKSPEAFNDMPRIITQAIGNWELLQARKWGEEELRKSELRYRDLFNNSQNAVAIYQAAADGADFIFKDFNSAAERIDDIKKDDIIGKSVLKAFPGVREFGFFEVLQRVWRTGVPERHPITWYRDERISGWRDNYVYRLSSGEIVAIYEDVTERKQAEEALQREQIMLARTEAIANIGSWEWDIATDTVAWSDELFRLFQRDPQEGAPSFAEQPAFYHPDDFALLRQAVGAAVADGTPYELELRAMRKDGETRVCVARGVAEMGPGGRPIRLFGSLQDITGRKRIEEALRESEKRLREVLDNSLDASYKRNLVTNTYDYFSPVFARISGYTPDEMNTLPLETVIDLIHPDDRAEIEHVIAESLSGTAGTSYQMDYRFKRKDGQYRWLQDQFTVMRDALGQPSALIGSVSDITVRKQSQEALRDQQWRLRSIIEGTHLGTWEWNVQTGETVFNEIWARIVGYTLDELSPISIKTWECLLHPDDQKRSDELLERHFSGELPYYNCECRVKHKDGHWVWVLDRGQVITRTADGKPLMMFGTHSDITARKQAEQAMQVSEEKYRNLLELLHEGIWAIDENARTTYVNTHMAEMLGYRVEEMQGKELFYFMDDRGRELAARNVERRRAGISETHDFEFIRKDGTRIYTSLVTTPVTDKDGTYRGAIAGVQDITDRKRLEEERQMVAKLQSVGLLAGGIAHDFNNILTSILGNISLAGMDAAPGSELQNNLEQAQKASLRAKALTVQLLTFAKGGAPVLKLASLTELLKDTAGFALTGSKVKCRFTIPADLWHAEIDSGQVSQVIHNLVLNAQQSMPNGGTIGLTAENLALSETQRLGRGLPVTAGDYVRIAVADQGSGIPVENLEKIFDPFFSTKQKGSGLGLATSFSIARQHGGHISVESEVGAGSTFYLYLPASTQTAVARQDKKEALEAVGRARILVMDDDQGIRNVAGRMLKHIGYEDVEFAEHGAEAIKLYKAAIEAGHPFSVVILDLTIAGGMGGEAAMQKLLKIDPGVKAIVSSGYMDDPVIAKFRDYGFSGMIAKPYTIDELRQAVQDVI